MRVIICGGGQVGYSIASYLSQEDNDVTVIDIAEDTISRINEELEANGISGHASDPEVLYNAGANDADLLIAVTHQDEVNMVSCQIAHSLFNVPKKIARIRSQSYLQPAWQNLFSRAHLPIDVIISPELEVAKAIMQRLTVPGTTDAIALAEGAVYLIGVVCNQSCPVVYTPLRQLPTLFPELPLGIVCILRQNRAIIPDGDNQMQIGDEVFFFVAAEHLKRAMRVFGHEEIEARRLVVMGGGNIGASFASMIREENPGVRLKIIEKNSQRAKYLSSNFDNFVILEGDGLSRELLEEANISRTEAFIAITNDDEANILGSLLAKQYGCERALTLITKNNYTSLVQNLGIDTTISPKAITVSSIMRHVRRGRIKGIHTLHDGFAEVIEAQVVEGTELANKPVADIKLPPQVVIGTIVRDGKVILPSEDVVIRLNDLVVLLAAKGQGQKVEALFSVHVELV